MPTPWSFCWSTLDEPRVINPPMLRRACGSLGKPTFGYPNVIRTYYSYFILRSLSPILTDEVGQ
jgi:hypothetical protein